MDFQIGQIIRMKKPHPCGGNTWGDPACWHGFPVEVPDLWTYGDDSKTCCGKRLPWICRGIKKK